MILYIIVPWYKLGINFNHDLSYSETRYDSILNLKIHHLRSIVRINFSQTLDIDWSTRVDQIE